MRPDNAHDQSAPQRLCGRKHHPPSRFLPSDLHLCPFLPIFAPIHVRKTSHPPSSSGLGLDSSPRPAAAIGGENLSLPRQRGANGAHRPQRRRTRRRMSRLPARHRSRHRPRWAARGRKRHARARPRAPNAPPMPSAPPFTGASARRQARQLQHLPFRARPLHRSHAASILLFRFHRGNTLSFRSTLDRSHGDCSRSAARPTDCLIFSPRFFFFSRRRAPIPSSRYTRWPPIVPAPATVSCRLGFASLHQGSSHAGRAALGASTAVLPSSLRVFARSVGRAQYPLGCTGSDRHATIDRLRTGVALWRKRTPSRRSHRPPPAVCSRFAPLPHVRRSVSPPQRCLCARHANGTSRAPTDSTFPFPVSAAPGAAEPLHPSFFLSFPCPKSFSRGCC